MNNKILDLTNPAHAYLFGFIQADGSLSEQSRNRGKLTIEILTRDEFILEEFKKMLPVKSSITRRTRDTNFAKDAHNSCFRVHDWAFRKELVSLGVPCGEKSSMVKPPEVPYSDVDYWRGVIDGDGSLGITSQNIPFISLGTSSDEMKNKYIDFVYKITGQRKTSSRNKRDNFYNIVVSKEGAQEIVKALYYDGCLALPRKSKSSMEVLAWERPASMIKREHKVKKWTASEDDYILSNTLEDSMNELERTKKSIETRLWRLKNGQSLYRVLSR